MIAPGPRSPTTKICENSTYPASTQTLAGVTVPAFELHRSAGARRPSHSPAIYTHCKACYCMRPPACRDKAGESSALHFQAIRALHSKHLAINKSPSQIQDVETRQTMPTRLHVHHDFTRRLGITSAAANYEQRHLPHYNVHSKRCSCMLRTDVTIITSDRAVAHVVCMIRDQRQ